MKLHHLVLSLCLVLPVSCSKPSPPPGAAARGKPTVYTVNYPLKYFAERVAGGAVDVVFPVVEGDPASWAPEPGQITAYQDADLVLLNGADYGQWVDRVSLAASRTVDTGAGFADRFIELEEQVTHRHGPGGRTRTAGLRSRPGLIRTWPWSTPGPSRRRSRAPGRSTRTRSQAAWKHWSRTCVNSRSSWRMWWA